MLLAASASAAPVVSEDHRPPKLPTPTTSSEVKSLREKVLHALFSGASKVSRLLPDTTSGVPVFGSLAHEYHAMTKWWCDDGGKLVAKLAESSLCQSRGPGKKTVTPEERKKATGEARSMLQHYCKTSQGQESQICIRSIGLIEAGKRFLHRVHAHVKNATNVDPSVQAARRAAALSG